MSQAQKDEAAGSVLLDIWKIIHAPRPVSTPTEIVTSIAKAIYSLPAELLNSIGAEVRRGRD